MDFEATRQQMEQFRDELSAFLLERKAVIRAIPEFCQTAKARAGALDTKDADQHCEVRNLMYLRRAIAGVPQVASDAVGSRAKVEKLNWLRKEGA